MTRKLPVALFLAIAALAPIVLYAIVAGPGYSGAPGDSPTGCIRSGCHTGTPNSGTGSIKIASSGGLTYIPGKTQQISVTITDSTEVKYGFQLSARMDSDPKNSAAGLLIPASDGYTQVVCANGAVAPVGGCTAKNGGSLEWIGHTVAGYNASNATPGSFTYTFSWTPPAAGSGTVTLYAAGEAVTGKDVVAGTETYLTSLPLAPESGSPAVVTAAINAAGFSPGTSLAGGSWVAIFGANLAPPGDSRLWNNTDIVNGALPSSLDGTSVTVNGKAAIVEFISPGQVNIQTPDDDALGPVSIVVSTADGSSTPFMSTYAKFAPGLFIAASPYVVAQHADNSYVSTASPAKPGETITVWGSGFGPANPPVPFGQLFSGASPLATQPTATIGGQPAAIQFAGVVGAGLVQLNVQIPDSIGNGDAAIVLWVGGVTTQGTNNLVVIHN